MALAVDADGVHLGQEYEAINLARDKAGQNFIIGATCHASLALAAQAYENSASYIAFGRFFPSATKANAPPAQTNILMTAKQEFTLPMVAIGGITVDNAPSLIDAGADAIAVCHDLFHLSEPAQIRARAEQYRQLFK